MLKEKVTVELPKGILAWFEMKAEHYGKSLEQQLADELIEDCVADTNNQELVGEVLGERILIDCGVHQDLWELGHEIEWIKWEEEKEK